MSMNQNPMTCDICKSKEETIAHSFLDYEMAIEVWGKVKLWWGLNNKELKNVEDVFTWQEAEAHNNEQKLALISIGIATLCGLWRNRNEATFKKCSKKAENIFLQIQKESFIWIDSRANRVEIDRSMWILSPKIVINPM